VGIKDKMLTYEDDIKEKVCKLTLEIILEAKALEEEARERGAKGFLVVMRPMFAL